MSTRAELAAVEPTEKQKNSKVYQHVDFREIEALLCRKEPRWVVEWLKGRYPTEDKDGNELEQAIANKRMQLSERTLTRYRDDYLPEAVPGITGYVVNSEIEALIGHRLPAPIGRPWELEVMETAVHVAQSNMARALRADEEMDMLNPITLEAQSKLVDTLGRSMDMKSRLGLGGYEAAPERQHIVSENSNVSVELQGRLDPKTGESMAVEPERLDLARQLLSATPGERAEILAAAREAVIAAVPAPDASIVDAEVVAEETPNVD
jgi:hypothetical protein